MDQVILQSQSRKLTTKSELKKSRMKGYIPGVLYGKNETTMHIMINEKEFTKLITKFKENVLIKLNLDNKEDKSVIIKEIQKNVLTHKPIHVDFYAVSLKEKIELDVPIKIIGEAPGVKNLGGILEHLLRNIRVRCLPTDIPKSIEIDVSGLNINQNIFVKDLPKSPKVEIISDPNSIIVNVVAPTKVEEAPAASVIEEITPTEPEVISKGKKEEAGEEQPATEKPEKAEKADKKEAPKKEAPAAQEKK